jgi:hypothetical protein
VDDEITENKKDGREPEKSEERESFKNTLIPGILGLIVDLIMETISSLSASEKMMVIIGLSVV